MPACFHLCLQGLDAHRAGKQHTEVADKDYQESLLLDFKAENGLYSP